jgi:hypothetical protein
MGPSAAASGAGPSIGTARTVRGGVRGALLGVRLEEAQAEGGATHIAPRTGTAAALERRGGGARGRGQDGDQQPAHHDRRINDRDRPR